MLQKFKVTSYALIILLLLFLPSQTFAACMEENECADAAEALDLKLGGAGHPFAGDWGPKGCYSSTKRDKYYGIAWFGTGGTESEMAAAPAAPKYRISCGPNAAPTEAAEAQAAESQAAAEAQTPEQVSIVVKKTFGSGWPMER
jgi:hypothetical protein